MIKRHPISAFFIIMSFLVGAMIWFIQSPGFALLFKNMAMRLMPANMGVQADFTEFAVKLFPPGISLRNPKIELREYNLLKMPEGTSVKAERIDLNFQPFQMFSGDIRVHEVVIVNGDANLVIDPSSPPQKIKKARTLDFHWDELFQVRAEAVVLENTRMHIQLKSSDKNLDFVAKSLRLGQWAGQAGLGYELSVELAQIRGSLLQNYPVIRSLDEARILAHVNRAGVQVDGVSMRAEGVQAEASGQIKGDLLNLKEKKLADISVRVEGQLKKISKLLNSNPRLQIEMDGRAAFTGRLRGDLERITETLRAEGNLEIKEPVFREWRADRLSTEGSFSVSPEGQVLGLKRVLIEAKESERNLSGRGGFGGKIEIGELKMNLSEKAPLVIPVQFERAHVHWLAASELKAVFPLELRVSGPTQLTYFPATSTKSWQLQAKTGLTISDFSLDNQRLGQARPRHRVFRLPSFKADGALTINSGGIFPNGFALTLPKSKFRVEGKIDFATGYDLHGFGQVDLLEVDEIAETKIRGQGGLNVHVHGPTKQLFIDFDADLKDASYLNMAFGDLKGRITWDDDPDHLVLSKLQLKKGETHYSADGMVDLGTAESLAIQIKVPEGNIQDLIQVFNQMVQPLWWFPHTLSGAIAGDIQVFGGISMKKLEVLSRLNGKGWEYLGERFDTVNVTGGYDKGRYHLSDFKASKHGGRLGGHIGYDADSEYFDWAFHSQQFTLSDLDHVAQLDVPIRGRLFFDSVGKGRNGSIQSISQAFLSNVAVRGLSMPPSTLNIKSDKGKLDVKGSALGGQGNLELSYDFSPVKESFLRADLHHIDFSPILLLLNPRAIPDPLVEGFASGAIALSFHAGKIEVASGVVDLSEYRLTKTGANFKLKHPVSIRISEGSFSLPEATLSGNHGEAVLSLRGHQGRLDGTVTGALDVSIAEFFTSAISQCSGVALLDFTLGGALKEPTLLGRGTFDNASLRVPSVESPFENITGVFQIRQNQILVQNLEADLAGGRVLAGGTITLYADRYPTLALRGNLTGNKLKIFPFQFAKIRGDLTVNGTELPYLIEGSILVDSALSKEKVFQQKQTQSLKAVQYSPPPSLRRMSDYPRFKLNIAVKSEGGLLVQNDLFDVDTKADVTVVNTLEAPRIVGNVELIQGKMVFKDRNFRIQAASAVFDSPTVLNPRFNLTASTDVGGVKVQLYAVGRIDKWKVELTSTPVMPESEIISLLAMGLTTTETKKLSSSDRAVFEQGEAASLLLHSLDFNREVENKTGIQIQLDESVNTQQGTSIFRPQTPGESTASPKIVFRKQVTKDLDISYGSTVGVGANSQKEVSAEMKVTPGLSVLGVYDSFENSSDPNNKQSSQPFSSQSYGMDLKIQKRFK